MADDGKVDKTELNREESPSDRLKAIRTLHQTVVGLRKALEESQSDLRKLRSNLPKNTCLFHSNLNLSSRYKKCHETAHEINKTDFNKNLSCKKISISMDNLSLDETEKGDKKDEDATEIQSEPEITEDNCKVKADKNIQPSKTDSEDSEEVDNIELIFTTDDTKALVIQGDLESISDGEFESKQGINQYDLGRHSVLIETDISKCGVLYEDELSTSNYKPVLAVRGSNAQERIGIRRSLVFNPKGRPILTEISVELRDSEVQTDISALPPNWKSEGHLINSKAGLSNFTTLPSKFSIPTKGNTGKKNLKLADKTKEARRILLSDIGFTSMVPELSRSVDHLCQKDSSAPNRSSHHYASKLLKSPATGTTSSSHSRFDFSSNLDWFDNSLSSDKTPSIQDLAIRKKQFRPSLHSLDDYNMYNQTCSVPPSPTHRRHSSIASYTLTGNFTQNIGNVSGFRNSGRKQKQRVTFKDIFYPRQSLPNINVDPEDSTDSLIDESEEYIRRSIDNSARAASWLMAGRTFSDPNMVFSPPLSAKPFIPRMPNDLRRGNLVKVINRSGRVVGGKVQFVGHVPGMTEQFIGILLSTCVGDSDGSFEGNRYFTCEKNFGLFVPFRKIVMAWKI